MSAPVDASLHLVLVHSEGWQDVGDFEQIKSLVESRAPDIEVFVVSNDHKSSMTRKRVARRPTLVFSPITLLEFRPDRGRVYAGRPMSKLEEMGRLAAAGVPIPAFEAITPETSLDPERFGDLVIVKPSYDLASWGRGIELMRREQVRYRPPEAFPPDHPGRHGPMIAQKFIDCGRPISIRVLTFFGEPVFTFCRESTKAFILEPLRDGYVQADYMPAPPDINIYTTRDPDVLQLARTAYAAMPDIALQACDILRDSDGGLHLLETNPGGGTWMFSSVNAPGYRRVLGIADLTKVFDAFAVIARILIERTRREAV
jgi:hypothetical protein